MRRMGPLGRFVRTRLHRRIFMWFGSGILFTALFVGGVMFVLARSEPTAWQASWQRAATWVGRSFAADWNDPSRREAFAKKTAAELDVSLALYAPGGEVLSSVGEACKPWHAMDLPVTSVDGQRLGTVRACFRQAPGPSWRFFLGFALALAALWMASGRVARRLARPLTEVADVVRRIGSGELSARAKRACANPDEIGVVAEAVNDMAARIEKQLADQRELLAAVSHELRTPLARVRVISEIARDSGATPKTFDDLDREVQEMDALVGELLAKSRVDFGTLSKRPLSAQDVALEAVERAGLAAEKATVPAELSVDADPTLLQRALANLLRNAQTHGGGVERLEVGEDSAGITFAVLDAGPGLPKDTSLFEAFQSGGSGEGLGLGLSLVKRIAEAHGGTVFAANRPEGGARVGLTLPRA